jgi:hypothetical protein
MKKGDGETDSQLSNQLSKVIDVCVDPDPLRRPSASKLLNTTLLKGRKKSLSSSTLKDLLLPVVPLDTSKLVEASVAETGLETQLWAVRTSDDIWFQ